MQPVASAALTATVPTIIIGVGQLSSASLYVNGVLAQSLTGGPLTLENLTGFSVNSRPDGSLGEGNVIAGAWVWNRILTVNEIASFSVNPWQVFQPAGAWLFHKSAVAAGSGYWPGTSILKPKSRPAPAGPLFASLYG